MIERAAFAERFTILQNRYGREYGQPVIREYYEILNPALTTAEFIEATRVVMREDEFFPTPQRIIDAALGAPDEHARAAWRQIQDAAFAGNLPALASLDALTRAALEAAPAREIRGASDYRLQQLREDFTRAYTKAARGYTGRPAYAPALPDAPRPAIEHGPARVAYRDRTLEVDG